MKIFIYEHCPFCLRVRMIVGLKNLAVQSSIIMEGDEETAKQMVGKKVVPILQKDDGTYLTESLNIVKYLDGLSEPYFTRGQLDPRVEKWLETYLNLILNLIVPRFTQANFKEIETHEARTAFIRRETKAFGDLDQLMAQSDQFIEQLNIALLELEPFFARLNIELTDFYLFPWLRSLTIVKGLVFGEKTQAYMLQMEKKAKVNLLFNQAQ